MDVSPGRIKFKGHGSFSEDTPYKLVDMPGTLQLSKLAGEPAGTIIRRLVAQLMMTMDALKAVSPDHALVNYWERE